VIGEGRGRCDGLPIDAVFALDGRVVVKRPFDAGAERCEPQRALDLGGDRPRAVALGKCHFIERGAAQAAAGREKRNGFDQVGLAGAVRTDEHDHRRVDFKRGRVIVAEIVEGQAKDGHQSSGIRLPGIGNQDSATARSDFDT
jgi:hypothetical protein